jgi:outer membrane murein-binding lipoprotein Lpp
MKRVALVVALIVLSMSCSSPKRSSSNLADKQAKQIEQLKASIDDLNAKIEELEKSALISAHDSIVFSLSKTPCLGSCPVYRVEVFADGFIKYTGKAHVERIGSYTGMATLEQMKGFEELFETSNFYAFQSTYDDGRTDIPSTVIEYYGTKGYKIVKASTQIPQSFRVLTRDLENLLDQVNFRLVAD